MSVLEATLAILERQHPAVREAARRLSILHWFDEELVAALCGDSSVPAGSLMVVLESLPFIEQHAESRLRHHSRVRAELSAAVGTDDPALARRLEQAAITELGSRMALEGLDADEALELTFHLIADDPEQGAELVDSLFDHFDRPRDAAVLDRLVDRVREQIAAGRVDQWIVGRCRLWESWAAATAGDDERAAERARAGLAIPSVDGATADLLTFQLARCEARLGDVAAAMEHAMALATGADDFLGIQGHMLAGELRVRTDEKLSHYRAALNRLIDLAGTEHHGDLLVPSQWGLAVDDDEVTVMHGPRDGIDVAFGADPVVGELWLRIGAAEASRGHLDVAREWLDLSRSLFELLRDDDGLRRAEGTARLVDALVSPDDHVRGLLVGQEQRVAEARAAGDHEEELEALLELAETLRIARESDRAMDVLGEAAGVAEHLDDEAMGRVAFARAWLAYVLGRSSEVRADLDRARALLPDTPAVRYDTAQLEGALLLDGRDAAGARAAFEVALQDADLLDDVLLRAAALESLAKVDRAERDLGMAEERLRRALILVTDVDAVRAFGLRSNLAEVLRLRHRDGEAETLEAAVEETAALLGLDSVVAHLHLSRGQHALRQDDDEQAVRWFEQALGRFRSLGDREGELDAEMGLAAALGPLGRHDEAIGAADRAVAIAEDVGRREVVDTALGIKGNALVEASRFDEAIELLAAGHRSSPEDPWYCINLGWACLRADRFEESLHWSEEALRLHPDDAFPYRNIGHALLGLGRLDEAKEAYRRAVEGVFGDEHFRNTLVELDLLRRRHPDLRGVDDVIAWFEQVQADLDSQ